MQSNSMNWFLYEKTSVMEELIEIFLFCAVQVKLKR